MPSPAFRTSLHLGEQTHSPDNVTACTPQIDGSSAGADAIGELNDRHVITTLVQPEGECGPRDSGSAIRTVGCGMAARVPLDVERLIGAADELRLCRLKFQQ